MFVSATPSVLLDDHEAALTAVRRRAETDPTRIVSLGSREGTWMAPLRAASSSTASRARTWGTPRRSCSELDALATHR